MPYTAVLTFLRFLQMTIFIVANSVAVLDNDLIYIFFFSDSSRETLLHGRPRGW